MTIVFLAQVQSVGKWNTYAIEVSSNLIMAKLNGTTTAVLQPDMSIQGFITLQHFNEDTIRSWNIMQPPITKRP